jgi:hypothetical protein
MSFDRVHPSANLEIVLDDLKRQWDVWQAQAERPVIAAQEAETPSVCSGLLARIGLGRVRYD